MIPDALPGERWEVEFLDGGRIVLKRFVSQRVTDAPGVSTELLGQARRLAMNASPG
jgi:hypothetical protein